MLSSTIIYNRACPAQNSPWALIREQPQTLTQLRCSASLAPALKVNRREFLAGVGVAAAAAATGSSATDASEMKTANSPFIIPKTRRAWDAKRAGIRATLWQLLGDLPPLVSPKVKVLGREPRDGYALEKFEFQNGLGARVPGYVLIPDGHKGRGPAILYNHWHGGQY